MIVHVEGAVSNALRVFIQENGQTISDSDRDELVDLIALSLRQALPGINPALDQITNFPDGDEIGAIYLDRTAPIVTASLRFFVRSSVQAGERALGYLFNEPIDEVRVPVMVTGTKQGVTWKIQICYDALSVLSQLGVQAVGRPVARPRP